MSEWITDRRPTAQDSDHMGQVWVTTDDGKVNRQWWTTVSREPWMPIVQPEPYVKPKRWQVNYSHTSENWYIWNNEKQVVQLYYLQDFYKHHEAAERIAAIYEEVMP